MDSDGLSRARVEPAWKRGSIEHTGPRRQGWQAKACTRQRRASRGVHAAAAGKPSPRSGRACEHEAMSDSEEPRLGAHATSRTYRVVG